MIQNLNTSALLLIISATVTFCACESTDRPTDPRSPKGDVHLSGTINIAESKNPGSLVPSRIADATASRIGTLVHCGLLRLDVNTLEVIPGIAETWSVDDKGTSYVFNLRTGVSFHDDECFGSSSREVTASDFQFSFEQLCASGSSAFASTFNGRVKGADSYHDGESEELSGIEVIDDYTLRIELERPDPSFLYILAQPSTAVVSAKASEMYGDEHRVGAGPFILLTDSNGLRFVRNTEYFLSDAFGNRLPYIDSLQIRFIPTRTKQLEAFFNGQIDMITGLDLDPVRLILEQNVADFSGKDPKYVMKRETESVGYESYTIYHSRIKGFNDNFMGYRDYSQVQSVN